MRRRTMSLLALVPLTALSLAGAPAPEGCYVAIEGDPQIAEDDVFACEQQTWFHRAATPAGNVGYVAEPHGLATFDTNPPAGSVTGGNGGGYFSTQALGNNGDRAEAEFHGTFTGVIDALDVDLHILVGVESTFLGTQAVDIDLTIDGIEFFSAQNVELTAVEEPASSAGSLRLDFAITGLAERIAEFEFPNAEDTEHAVVLEVRNYYTDSATIYAFDTTEVPGGITFNPLQLPADSHELPG